MLRQLLLASLLLPSACRKGPAEAPSPRLRFEPDRLDLGSLVQDQPKEATVAICNDGARALDLGTIAASRFCTATVEAVVVPPGQTTRLLVRCQSDLYGPLREGIHVDSNDPRLPKALLEVVAAVTPLLAFDVPSIHLKMPFGEERSHDVHLVGSLVDKAQPRLTGLLEAAADSEVIPLPASTGTPPGYRLRCLGRKVGTSSGSISLATGLAKPGDIAIPFVCTVTGTLEVSPATPYFNLKVSGDKRLRIVVRSSQPDFKIRDVRVTDGPFAAHFERAPEDKSYSIDVTVLNERIPDEARAASGTLLIISNDRTEPRKQIPLFGSGRINKIPLPNE